jgi:hypothetical protein
MGRVIRPQLAAREIEDDLRGALNHARKGEPEVVAAGERFLGGVVARCKALRRAAEDVADAAVDAASAFAAADRRARATLGRVRDEIFNRIGRRKGNPAFQIMFPDGAITVLRCPEERRAARAVAVALRIDTIELRGVSEMLRRGLARKVREAADALSKAHQAKVQAKAAAQDAKSDYVVAARAGARLLSRFKKHLAAEGMTEAAIHEIIPHRPRTPKRRAEAESAVDDDG